jgi:hypothetical protein
MPAPEHEKRPDAKWIKPERAISDIYANMIHPTWTLYDVRLVFGQLMARRGDPAGAEFVVEEQGGVTLSWAEAKVLRDIMVGLLASYEAVNGEIKVPNLAPREAPAAAAVPAPTLSKPPKSQ